MVGSVICARTGKVDYRGKQDTSKSVVRPIKSRDSRRTYFPEKFAQTKEVTLRTWINEYIEEGSTNRSIQSERHYGRFWKLLLGKRVLSQVTTDECRRIQAKLNARRTKVNFGKRNSKNGKTLPCHDQPSIRILTACVDDSRKRWADLLEILLLG